MRLVRETLALRRMVELSAIAHYTRHATDEAIARERAALADIATRAAGGITPR